MNYIVQRTTETGDAPEMTARGERIEVAAAHVARRLAGRRAVAHRCTGRPGLSGLFAAYLPVAGRLTHSGIEFHIR